MGGREFQIRIYQSVKVGVMRLVANFTTVETLLLPLTLFEIFVTQCLCRLYSSQDFYQLLPLSLRK